MIYIHGAHVKFDGTLFDDILPELTLAMQTLYKSICDADIDIPREERLKGARVIMETSLRAAFMDDDELDEFIEQIESGEWKGGSDDTH